MSTVLARSRHKNGKNCWTKIEGLENVNGMCKTLKKLYSCGGYVENDIAFLNGDHTDDFQDP